MTKEDGDVNMVTFDFNQYASTMQNIVLSGVGHFHYSSEDIWIHTKTGKWPCSDDSYECLGLDPLEQAKRETYRFLRALDEFRTHIQLNIHAWDDNGFCDYCGWDGNA